MQEGFLTRVRGFLAQPFKSDGNALDWVLFLALAVTVAFFWSRVLKSIAD